MMTDQQKLDEMATNLKTVQRTSLLLVANAIERTRKKHLAGTDAEIPLLAVEAAIREACAQIK